MALTQMELIRSLGEALAWFQREMDWGIAPAELRHLSGRIGELYAALITNGQLALQTNQKGYDVVSKDNQRISVKTTTMSEAAGHISFNLNTLDQVDRIIILRINDEEMEIETLLDKLTAEAQTLMHLDGDKGRIAMSKLLKKPKVKGAVKTVKEVTFEDFRVRELESGTIEVEKAGLLQVQAKPTLREIALKLNVGIVNSNGIAYTTRQLGTMVIKAIKALKERDEIIPRLTSTTTVR